MRVRLLSSARNCDICWPCSCNRCLNSSAISLRQGVGRRRNSNAEGRNSLVAGAGRAAGIAAAKTSTHEAARGTPSDGNAVLATATGRTDDAHAPPDGCSCRARGGGGVSPSQRTTSSRSSDVVTGIGGTVWGAGREWSTPPGRPFAARGLAGWDPVPTPGPPRGGGRCAAGELGGI